MLFAVMLDRGENRPGELSSFYSTFSMGAAMENVWLATVELGMGIQFISFPMEVPGRWEQLERIFRVPDDLQLMAVYRLGYVPGRSSVDLPSTGPATSANCPRSSCFVKPATPHNGGGTDPVS
jgi:hypothetical protein